MKTAKCITVFLLSLVFISNTFAQKGNRGKGGGMPSKVEVELVDVLKEIQVAIDEAKTSLAGITLKEAEVSFQVDQVWSAEGGIKFFVKAKGNASKGTSTTMNFTLKAENEENKMVASDKKKLAQAIMQAAEAYKAVKKDPVLNGLSAKSFSIELSVEVKRSAGGGVEFEIGPIGIDASGNHERTNSHAIKLTFE